MIGDPTLYADGGLVLKFAGYHVEPAVPAGRKLCELCGTPFKPKNRLQRFCHPGHTRTACRLRRAAENAEHARARAAEAHRRLADFGQASLFDPDLAGPIREDPL